MGSPAPAGIDPARTARAETVVWFPRTRGDRPYVKDGDVITLTVPPHPRG